MNTPSIEERLVEEFREHWGTLWTGDEDDETYTKFEAWFTSALSQVRQDFGTKIIQKATYQTYIANGKPVVEMPVLAGIIEDLSALTTEGE